jgi:MFS family permease
VAARHTIARSIEGEMNQPKHVLRNLATLGSDFALFSVGFAFIDPYVVLPAFAQELTPSPILIGALTAIRLLMITVPQLWAASILVAQPRKKPLLVISSIGGRLPVLLLAGAAWAWAAGAPWAVILVLLLMVALFYTSEGLNSISWPDLVGKVIPARLRGRFLGVGQLFSSLGALGAGYVLRIVLGGTDSAMGGRWALVFAISFVFLMLSVLAIALTHEEPDDVQPTPVDIRQSLRLLIAYLRADRDLQRVIIVQVLLGSAATAFPFFVVRAGDLFQVTGETLGLYVILQNLGGVAAALLCGYLIDKVGSWAAIRAGAWAQAGALLAVTLAGTLGLALPLYWLAFVLLGFVTGSSWWSFTAYLMDMATAEQRPTYLAASGVLKSPVMLVSLVSGVFYQFVVAEVAFGVGLLVSVLGVALCITLHKHERAEGEA